MSEQMNASWVRSSLSFSNGNCVEAASLPGGEIGVRDSRRPEGPVLRFTPGEWDAFVGRTRLGEFDRVRGHTGASSAGRRPAGPELDEAAPLPAETVEFPVPHAAEESAPLIGGEPQDGPRRVPAVANADLATGQARHLDAVAVGVTQGALDPTRT